MDQQKQHYETPELTTYGTLNSITQSVGTIGTGDLPFKAFDGTDFSCDPDPSMDKYCSTGS